MGLLFLYQRMPVRADSLFEHSKTAQSPAVVSLVSIGRMYTNGSTEKCSEIFSHQIQGKFSEILFSHQIQSLVIFQTFAKEKFLLTYINRDIDRNDAGWILGGARIHTTI